MENRCRNHPDRRAEYDSINGDWKLCERCSTKEHIEDIEGVELLRGSILYIDGNPVAEIKPITEIEFEVSCYDDPHLALGPNDDDGQQPEEHSQRK